ncbi:MAG: hypothetical protein CMC08_07935 [Flavobacteriaceae bacterium]|nr:hypothetical protein [Flavobacteriaceae bacterium]
MEEYIGYTFPVFAVELTAALTGLYYLKKNPRDFAARIFVYMLCYMVLAEFIGSYAVWAYYSDYTVFGFVENTVFEKNYWWFNIYTLISSILYIEYFRRQLYSKWHRRLVLYPTVLFAIIETINLIAHPDMFFNAYSAFANIAGTIIVLLAISLYYYQLLNNDDILQFRTLLPFYVSVGAIILYITHTPLFIYSKYFNTAHGMEFVEMYRSLMFITNVLVYLTYSIGFVVCLRKKGSSSSIL